MKQKQIMSNNKMKCLSKLVVIMMFIFFSYCSFGQSKKSSIEAIKVENKIRLFSFQEVEYAILKISYKNISKDTIYLWTQNWRVHYLKEQDSSMFNNCPFDINAGFLNAIIFFKSENVTAFNSKSARFDYFEAGDKILNCSFVKKILPGETFSTNIIFSDTDFVSYMKKYQPDALILYYSYTNYFMPKIELENNFYYQEDEIFINYLQNPESINCQTNNVVSKNGIQEELDRNKYQAVFNPNRISLKLNW